MEPLMQLELDLNGISEIHDLAVDGEGCFFVSDEFNHRIVKFSGDGQQLLSFGKLGEEHGSFHYPRGLTLNKNRLFVADSWNHRIQVFDLNGKFINSFGHLGDGDDAFQVPTDIKLGPNGLLWVVDSDNHRIMIFDCVSLKLSSVFWGGVRGDQLLIRNKQVKVQEGLSLYYPSQIFFFQDVAYLQDGEKLTRLGPQLIDHYHFKVPMPRCALLGASEGKVVMYNPHMDQALLYNFSNFRAVPLFRTREKTRWLFNRNGKLWLLGDGTLNLLAALQPESFLEGNVSAPALDLFSLDAEVSREHLQVDSVLKNLSPDHPETLTNHLFEVVPLQLLEVMQNEQVCLDVQGGTPLSLGQPLSERLSVDFLTLHGWEVASRMERCYSLFNIYNSRLIARLPSLLSQASPDQCLTFCSEVATCFVAFFRKVYARRFELLARLREVMQEDEALFDAALIRRLDCCLFHVDRLLQFSFQMLVEFRECLQEFGLLEAVAKCGINGFLVATVKRDFLAFEPHLLNCLHRLGDLSVADNPSEAMANGAWAIEGAALAAAFQLLPCSDAERFRLQTRQLGFSLCANREQLFRHGGRLFKAFCFPYQILDKLRFSIWVDLPDNGDALFQKVCNSRLWELASMRKDMALYQANFPDISGAITTLRETVTMLEQNNRVHLAGEASAYHPDYVAAVWLWAYYLALVDPHSKALEILEKIKGDPYYFNTRAKILASQGEFDQALEVCQAAGDTFWALKLTQGTIHLYRGDWESAAHLFANPIASFPPNLAALFLAISYRTGRCFKKALVLFEQLESVAPQTLPYQLGILYRMMDQDEQALECFAEQKAICPFSSNHLEELLTLRKLARLDQYEVALAGLPKQAFLQWNYQRLDARHALFTETLDHYLRVEREQLPELGCKQRALEHLWVIQPRLITPMFFTFQDTFFSRCQTPCPATTNHGSDSDKAY